MTSQTVGIFLFGFVIGWLVYYTNRYRTGDVKFSDLGTLIGVIGGGAVTTLFGDAADNASFFGLYGIGLAAGFFTYFIFMIILVLVVEGFTLAAFIDGRRPKLKEDEIGPEPDGGLGNFRPFNNSSGGLKSKDFDMLSSFLSKGTTPSAAISAALSERSTVFTPETARSNALSEALRLRRLVSEALYAPNMTEEKWSALRSIAAQLDNIIAELEFLRLDDIWNSPEVEKAVASLRQTTDSIKKKADDIKDVTETYQGLTRVVTSVTNLLNLIR